MRYLTFGPVMGMWVVPDRITKEMLVRGRNCTVNHNTRLAGHLDSQFRFSREDIDYLMTELEQDIATYVMLLEDHLGLQKAEDGVMVIECSDMWINYMKAGDFNPEHTHAHDNNISFVYYLDVPDLLIQEHENYEGTDNTGPGGISFKGPAFNSKLARTNNNLFPHTGDLLIFPADLPHMVYPFKSDCVRISISGNLKFNHAQGSREKTLKK